MQKDVASPRDVYGRINGFPVCLHSSAARLRITRSFHVRFAPAEVINAIFAIDDAPHATPDDFLANACANGFTPDASAEWEYRRG